VRFVVDHNFHEPLLAGALRRDPTLSVTRARDVSLDMAEDPELLEWAAQNKRVVLSHDVQTLEGFAYERVKKGLTMPGVVEITLKGTYADLIEDILIVASCDDSELENRVIHILLR
jgi:predicted nuclease of predicted toxin-antitoxin system